MRTENEIVLDRFKLFDTHYSFHVYNFEYEKELEIELRKLGIEIDRLELKDGEPFRVLIYPSREDYIRVRITYGYLELKDYIPASEYQKLEEEYSKSGEKGLGLEKWLMRKGKVRDAELVIPPEDYVYTVFRTLKEDTVYDVKRGWYSNGFA